MYGQHKQLPRLPFSLTLVVSVSLSLSPIFVPVSYKQYIGGEQFCIAPAAYGQHHQLAGLPAAAHVLPAGEREAAPTQHPAPHHPAAVRQVSLLDFYLPLAKSRGMSREILIKGVVSYKTQ